MAAIFFCTPAKPLLSHAPEARLKTCGRLGVSVGAYRADPKAWLAPHVPRLADLIVERATA
ncbi:MAG: hypothetical protein OXL68_16570 [Paracoccaceae bacterium]|nr:hypothetical protein [Paracoccaceae bacterium]